MEIEKPACCACGSTTNLLLRGKDGRYICMSAILCRK